MDFFKNIRRKMESFFAPQNIQSPVPEADTLNTPGKLNYVAQNQARENQPVRDDSMQNGKIRFPDWMANAPGNIPGNPPVAGGQVEESVPASELEQIIRAGMEEFGNPPAATMAAQLAQAGEGLPDALLPAILALMESGGGRNMATPNNLFNLGPGIEYPELENSIIGGGPRNQLGMKGVLNNGIYDDYLESGDLADFFRHFTPSSDPRNPSQDELISRYGRLRDQYFE